MVFIKKMVIKDGKPTITFDSVFEFPRNKPEADLFKVLTSMYEE